MQIILWELYFNDCNNVSYSLNIWNLPDLHILKEVIYSQMCCIDNDILSNQIKKKKYNNSCNSFICVWCLVSEQVFFALKLISSLTWFSYKKKMKFHCSLSVRRDSNLPPEPCLPAPLPGEHQVPSLASQLISRACWTRLGEEGRAFVFVWKSGK